MIKKGMVLGFAALVLMACDNRNMEEVQKEQEQSIEKSTDEILNDDTFGDDIDMDDVEDVTLAIDTTKVEK